MNLVREGAAERHVAELLIGDSAAMQHLRRVILKIAPTGLPVLIQGPTGAGKELVAQAVHAASGREGALISFNVCAIAESMFEDTLFGHVRGAFTGAVRDSSGYLAEADGGTIFFDEISGLPISLQAKLLRVLETQQFRPVGACRDRRSDFRSVAATNEDLHELTRAGHFRRDLLHRLAGMIVEVPALRDRREDIPSLVRHFTTRSPLGQERATTFAGPALDLFEQHDWPGNVRELRSAVERACALAEGPVIGARDVAAALRTGGVMTPVNADEALTARRQLLHALEHCAWDTKAVALQLGVNRVTVYRRMQRLGIAVPRIRAPRTGRISRASLVP